MLKERMLLILPNVNSFILVLIYKFCRQFCQELYVEDDIAIVRRAARKKGFRNIVKSRDKICRLITKIN